MDIDDILTCGCGVLIFVTNILLGAWSVNVVLDFVFNKTIPFLGAALIGLVAGQFTVPVAIVLWVLQRYAVI